MTGKLRWGRWLAGGVLMALALPALGATPVLRLESIIGEARGRALDSVHVTVSDTGSIYLLMRNGRIAVFNREGAYQQSLKSPVATSWTGYLREQGGRLFLGDYRSDFPWVFDDRRQGEAPGRFQQAAMVVADAERVYVSDRGNSRLQVFDREQTDTPAVVFPLEARPGPLAIRGTELALVDEKNVLRVYTIEQDKLILRSSLQTRQGAQAVALGPDQTVYIAYRWGRNHGLCAYERKEGGWGEERVIAPSIYESWPHYYPAEVPLVIGPDRQLWFATDTNGTIASLDITTDRVTERVKGVHRPLVVGFDAGETLYVGGFPSTRDKGPVLQRYSLNGEPLGAFGPPVLYDGDTPVWAVLPDQDGGVYVRIVESGYRKGWPALTIKKVYPDGKMTNLLDLGSLYAVRTRFAPSESIGNFVFDREGYLIIAASFHLSVQKVAPDGTVIWEASQYPVRADPVPFGALRDVAIDSRGHIWVTDPRRHVIVCLSDTGKLLLTHGGFGGVDDLSGNAFDRPTGIAVVTTDQGEYLVVGDAGNHRFLKYRLDYAE
jgi:DNA-binding beta-propeller fold protein YncE